jgi:hypothetical protein
MTNITLPRLDGFCSIISGTWVASAASNVDRQAATTTAGPDELPLELRT